MTVGKSVLKTAAPLLLGSILSVIATTGHAAGPADKTEICAAAEQRYQQIYGKPSSEEEVTIVKMHKFTFCPPNLEVAQGTIVRWINVDKRTSHSVWFKQRGFEESERIFPDVEEKVEMTFDLPPGDYSYLCGPHWESDDMRGVVTVMPTVVKP